MNENLATRTEIWDEFNQLFDATKFGSAVKLARELETDTTGLNKLAQHSATLAELNKRNKNDPEKRRSIGYALIAGYCYIKMSRMALALAQTTFLKEIPNAANQVAQLEHAISIAFSKKTETELKPVTDMSDPEHKPDLSSETEGSVNLFSSLTADETQQLISKAEQRELPKEALLFREGDKPKAFYVVAEGELELCHQGGHRRTLKEGDFFGEIALLGKMNRTATVKALQKTKLIEFSESLLRKSMEDFPDIAEKLNQFYRLRLFLNVAGRSIVFKDISLNELEDIYQHFETHSIEEEKRLFKTGEHPEAIYLICRGYVRVVKGDHIVAHLGPGQFVGEVGLITGKPRSADIISTEPVRYLKCKKYSFEALVQKYPKLKISIEELAKLRDPESQDADNDSIID